MADEEFAQEVEHETEERIANLKIQREEIVQRIMAANFRLMKHKRQVLLFTTFHCEHSNREGFVQNLESS